MGISKLLNKLVLCTSLICGVSASAFAANDIEFDVIEAGRKPADKKFFYYGGDQNEAGFLATDVSKQTLTQVEEYFEQAAKELEKSYSLSFSQTLAVAHADVTGEAYYPIFVVDDYDFMKPDTPLMGAEGPIRLFGKSYFLRSLSPLVTKAFIENLDKPEAARDKSLSAQLPELAVSYAMASFADASQCKPWPSIGAGERSLDIETINNRRIGTDARVSVAMARAIQMYGKAKGLDDYNAILQIADTLAEASRGKLNDEKVIADAQWWLGYDNLKRSLFRGFETKAARRDAFADALTLALISRDSPMVVDSIAREGFNLLKDYDAANSCALNAYSAEIDQALNVLAKAFEKAEGKASKDLDWRRYLIHAQLQKIYLPYELANARGGDFSHYNGTILEKENWFQTLFLGDGCATIDLDEENDWYAGSEEMDPFSIRCVRIQPNSEDIQTFTFSAHVQGVSTSSPEEALSEYEDLVVVQETSLINGILSDEFNREGKAQSKLFKTWYMNTDPTPIKEWRQDDGSILFFIFNYPKDITKGRKRTIDYHIIRSGVEASISAIDYEEGQKRTDPPVKYPMPPLPSPLTTPVSFDLQSADEYEKPKLILSFSYASDMKALTQEFNRVLGDAFTSPFESEFTAPGKEKNLASNKLENIQSLTKQLREFQANALETRFGETVNVIIEAPAPAFGYTGKIDNVLISVNWEDDKGRPHEVESIGPEDMSSDSTNEIYLKNGTLNIRHFDNSLFVADFEGSLTDEKILPPMGPKKPHKDRVVTGKAKGTLVASGFDVASSGKREFIFEPSDEVLEQAILKLEERAGREEAFDRNARKGRTPNAGSGSGAGGVGPQTPALTCDCSCSGYWSGGVSRSCAQECKSEYLMCRATPSLSNKGRLSEHREAIEYYWEIMGLNTPEQQDASKEAIENMTNKEFQFFLEGIEITGGPAAPKKEN